MIELKLFQMLLLKDKKIFLKDKQAWRRQNTP